MKKIALLLTITLSALISFAQWVPQNSGTVNNLWSVFFTDVNNGYVGGSLGTILKTTDGGMNWSSQNSGTNHTLFSIYFTDISKGIALGNSGTIFKTYDGGNNWTKQIIDSTYSLTSVFFTSTDTGYIAGYYTGDGGVIYGIILKTINGGEYWDTFTRNSCHLRSICFPSSDVGYAVGTTTTQPPFYIILKTNDSGESWASTLLPSMGNTLRSVYFINTDVGYTVGDEVILKTIDGGINWTSQSVGENLQSVYFTDINTGYIAVSNGKIMKTINAGTDWFEQRSETSEHLSSVFFPSQDTGYAVGYKMEGDSLIGLILKTSNGGEQTQSCLPEGITFTTQAQIDSFQINYPNCTEIEGDVKIGAWLGSDIYNLNGLNVVTNIGGGLAIGWWFMGNALLTNLTGLDNLTYIGGDLDIHANLLLQNLTGLGSLTSIGGDIRIGNGDMSSNNGSKMNGNGNPSLKNLAGLENLVSIGGGLYTQFNDSLISFEGLEKLDSLKGIIIGDPIASFSELNNLSYIGNDGLTLSHTKLNNLTGLENVTSIAGDLIIDGNDSLVSLAGLENLASINGNLAIGGYFHHKPGNSSLLSLTGLRNLASIGGNLIIDKNAVLTSFTGLENLTSVEGGNLLIGSDTTYWGGGNPSLISLEGLNNIDANSISGLSIIYNTLLNTCEVESICDYLVAPNGTVEINNNATGCNSLQEVEEACAQSVDEISVISDLSIHPNPFTTSTTILYELTKPSTVQITIYDYLGKQLGVIERKKAQGKQQITWNAEGLLAGVYFCVVKANQGSQTIKLIKL